MSAGCPACGFLNPGDAAYCGRCGRTLGRTCSSCGAGQLPTDVTYCTSCGAELEQPEPALERKIVSVVFVDVVGFTKLAEKLDPEDVRRIIDPYYARPGESSKLRRHRREIHRRAVMALFGAPAAHEDDAERAVRAPTPCARRLAARRRRLGELQVRIGIATGEAIVALNIRPEDGTRDGPRRCRQHGRADPGGRAGRRDPRRRAHVSRHALPDRLSPRAAASAKGKTTPVAVWEVVAPRGRWRRSLPSTRARSSAGRASARARRHARRGRPCRREPRSSRSSARPDRQVPPRLGTLPARRARGGADLLAPGPLPPVRRRRHLLGARRDRQGARGDPRDRPGRDGRDEAPDRRRGRLPSRAEARWVADTSRRLPGVAPAQSSAETATEAFAAWRRFFEAIAAQRPLVLVFEDLHWADDGLLEFVAALLGERFSGPLSGRGDLPSRAPRASVGWGGHARARRLELEPLSDDETARLVADMLEAPELPPELAVRVAQRSRRKPAVRRGVRPHAGRPRPSCERRVRAWSSPSSDLPLPESVQAIVAARLDALSRGGEAARSGRRGRRQGVLAGGAPDDRRGAALVRRARAPRARAEAAHPPRARLGRAQRAAVLVPPHRRRDVAYGQIPRAVRAERHSRAARWLEGLSPGRARTAQRCSRTTT